MKTFRASTAAFLIGFALQGLPAFAGELYGVKMPDTDTVAGHAVVLNGIGARKATILGIKVYMAGLYVESKNSDANAILASAGVKKIHMQFVRSVEADKIREAWSEGLAKKENCGDACASYAERLNQINSWMADMKDGETMDFIFTDKGVQVIVKGQSKGEVPGADFGRALLSIWLGTKPPNKELKVGMLGQ